MLAVRFFYARVQIIAIVTIAAASINIGLDFNLTHAYKVALHDERE